MRLIILLYASALSAQPAEAPASQKLVSETISYADLNLASIRDQHRLRDRISFAAYRVCLVDGPASPSPSIADPACFHHAIEQGMKQMNSAMARTNIGPRLAEARSSR